MNADFLRSSVDMKKQHIGIFFMVIAAMGLAGATIMAKVLPQVSGLTPGQIATWRFAIATPLMTLFIYLRRSPQEFIPKSPFKFLGLGVVYMIAGLSALFALDRLSSSLYVIIIYIYPSLVVFYSLLTGRSVPRLFWLGLPMTFIGLILTAYNFGQSLSVDLIGFLIALLNAVAMAAYLILSEVIFKKSKGRLLGTNWVFIGAMIGGFLLFPVMGINTPDSMQGWVLLITYGIFGTLVPILAMNIGLQLIGAARGSIIITLQPVLAVILSMVLLSETLTLQQWIGGALVIGAVVLLQQSPDRIGDRESAFYRQKE